MRKITFFLAIMLSVLMANAQTSFPVDETFATGFPNPTVAGSTLTANGWTTVLGAGMSSALGSKTTTTAMTYPAAGTTFINSGVGNALYNNYTGASGTTVTSYSYKQFQDTPVSTGLLYLSFLYKCTANGGSGSQIIGLSDLTSSGNSGAIVYGSYASATGLRLGVTRGSASNTDVQFGTQTITLGTVYLIVMKYDFTTAKATLFVNPTINGSEAGATVWSFDDGTNGKAARPFLQYLKVCNSGANKAYFNVSGIRISQTWLDATAPYVSVLPALGTPDNSGGALTITNNGFNATWANGTTNGIGDANATGFSVKTYIGTNLIPVNTTTAAAGSTSVTVTGLMSGLDYTYKVTAIGDNTTYQNSAESAPVAFTTTGRVSSINSDFSDGSWGTVYNTSTVPATGSYPTSSSNGFDLINTLPYSSTNTGPKGEVHTVYLKLDKLTYGGMLIFPTVSTVQQLEIHGYPASAPRDFLVKQYIGGVWTPVGPGTNGTIGTYTMSSTSEGIFTIPITVNNTNAKFRIENGGPGGINITQVIARNSTPALLSAPTIGTAGNINSTDFTANWTPADANATGYAVFVYNGTTLAGSYPVNGQATTSLEITGLTSNTTYTYKVLSKGDGDLLFSDSYLSVPSAGFTTNMAAPVVQPATGITTSGFTANWLPVTGAASYDVYLYDNTAAQVGSTVNVSAPTVSLSFSGLTQDVSYTFYVIARGDGTTTFDSALSAGMTAIPSTATNLKGLSSDWFITATGKTIISSETGMIQVYNLQGAKMLEAKGTNKVITNLASGIYLVKFIGFNGEVSNAKVQIK